MKRLALFLIGLATPAVDREWVVGDTIEQFDHIEGSQGPSAARRWLRREVWRVLWRAPRHRLAVRGQSPFYRNRKKVTVPFSARGDGIMSAVGQDLRYALGLLERSPGFTTVATATLALGIGANTAMFSVVNAVLLKPLPFSEPERLMLVHTLVPDRDAGPGVHREGVWSYPKYRSFLELQRTFEDTALFAGRDFNLAGEDDPERVRGEVITERYPAVIGITPILGRAFTYDEAHREGTPAVAMIGHGLWTRRYGGDPAILGRTIQINATPYTVVGGLPRGFRGLNGNAELWVPLAVLEPSQLSEKWSHSYTMIARRKASVSEQAAIAAVRVNGDLIGTEYSQGMDSHPVDRFGARLQPRSTPRGPTQTSAAHLLSC